MTDRKKEIVEAGVRLAFRWLLLSVAECKSRFERKSVNEVERTETRDTDRVCALSWQFDRPQAGCRVLYVEYESIA